MWPKPHLCVLKSRLSITDWLTHTCVTELGSVITESSKLHIIYFQKNLLSLIQGDPHYRVCIGQLLLHDKLLPDSVTTETSVYLVYDSSGQFSFLFKTNYF